MRSHAIHRVMVTERDALVGIVTRTDLANAVADHKLREHEYVFGSELAASSTGSSKDTALWRTLGSRLGRTGDANRVYLTIPNAAVIVDGKHPVDTVVRRSQRRKRPMDGRHCAIPVALDHGGRTCGAGKPSANCSTGISLHVRCPHDNHTSEIGRLIAFRVASPHGLYRRAAREPTRLAVDRSCWRFTVRSEHRPRW